MMKQKKKALKIGISTAIAASAFVAVAPTPLQADAASNMDTLLKNANNASTVLKWAISVEGSADFKTRPYDEYNTAKKAIEVAEKAMTKLSNSEKLSAQSKLVDPKIQVTRAQNYIDAITSSEKIMELTKNLNTAIASGKLADVETSYHKATAEFRKQSVLLDRVYGQTTRDGIRNAVKPQLEKTVDSVKYDVTLKMYADKAAGHIKKKEYSLAAKEIEKAQYIMTLKGVKFTFQKEVQKLFEDVYASLPIMISELKADGKDTLTLSLNKPFEGKDLPAITADAFKIKDLDVKSAKLSVDKKSIVIKTENQKSNYEYALTWNKTTYKFVTPKGEQKATISFNKSGVTFLESTDSNSLTATFKNKDGTPYVGEVSINLTKDKKGKSTAVISSVNGEAVKSPSSTWKGFANQQGSVVFTYAAAKTTDETTRSATHVVPEFKTLDGDGVTEYGPMTHFMQAQYKNAKKDIVIPDFHLDTARDYVFADDVKWSWDSNDLFFIRGSEVNQETFEKSISKGDKLSVIYEANTKNVSSWTLQTDGTVSAELTFTNPSSDSVTLDVSQFKLEGTGEPGNMIRLYRNGSFLASVTVDKNGHWSTSTNLEGNKVNTFTAYQYLPGTDGENGKNSVGKAEVKLLVGAFAAESIKLNDPNLDGLSIGDSLHFTFLNNDKGFGHAFEDGSAGTVTLKDGQGKQATISIKEEKDGKSSEIVKIVDFVYLEEGFSHKSSPFNIIAVEGMQNRDKLEFSVDKSSKTIAGTEAPVPVPDVKPELEPNPAPDPELETTPEQAPSLERIALAQGLIDALPMLVTEETFPEAEMKLGEAKAELNKLSEHEKDKVTQTKLGALEKQISELRSAMLFTSVQKMIDELPLEVNEETLSSIQEKLDAIEKDVSKLSSLQQAKLDFTKFDDLQIMIMDL